MPPVLGWLVLAAGALGGMVWVALTRFRLRVSLLVQAGSGPGAWHLSLDLSWAGVRRRYRQRWLPAPALEAVGRFLAGRRGPGPDPAAVLMAVLQAYWRPVARRGGWERLEAQVTLSLGDAAATALACGLVNAIMGLVGARLQASPARPLLVRAHCRPDWAVQAGWTAEARCILRPTLSQAISAAWYAYRLWRSKPGKGRSTSG